jgi:sugar transferase EpsL
MSPPRQPYPGKRLFDLVVTAVLALPVAAIGAVCALAVRLTSPGPILFRQARVGHNGATFTMLKLRTMRHDGKPNPLHPDKDRITPVGRVLRRTSLDELPQLVNVARGEMSIVGPRPTLRYQVDRYDERQLGRLAAPASPASRRCRGGTRRPGRNGSSSTSNTSNASRCNSTAS